MLLLVLSYNYRIPNHLLLGQFIEVLLLLTLQFDVVTLNRNNTFVSDAYVPDWTRGNASGFNRDGGKDTVVNASSLLW